MPKLIDDARGSILAAAKRLLEESGYSGLTIRRVANECGIACGTVYNYFESKEVLAASVILSDWLITLDRIKEDCETVDSPTAGLRLMYDCLIAFQQPFLKAWHEYSFSGNSGRQVFGKRHEQLVSQLAGLIHTLLCRFDADEDDALDRFIAENLLIAINDKHSFEPFAALIGRVIICRKNTKEI